MSDDIFNLLMLILMLENGGGTQSINQLVITFLLMQNRSGASSSLNNLISNRNSGCNCDNDGFTF
ncbi:MAG: hypothetical protein K2M48_00890 [Clostridiales bacterium]|nr:hypothetical protein [Clostridiales bacterium]